MPRIQNQLPIARLPSASVLVVFLLNLTVWPGKAKQKTEQAIGRTSNVSQGNSFRANPISQADLHFVVVRCQRLD